MECELLIDRETCFVRDDATLAACYEDTGLIDFYMPAIVTNTLTRYFEPEEYSDKGF